MPPKTKSPKPEDLLMRVVHVAELLAKGETVAPQREKPKDSPKTQTDRFDVS